MKKVYLLLLFVAFLSKDRLCATSIIPFLHLGEVAQASDAVVLATAGTRFEIKSDVFVFYDCPLQIKEVVKGNFHPGESLDIRQHSHRMGDFEGVIAGDFVPEEGKTYLLFLKRSGSIWRPITMAFYVFEVKKNNNESFLVPLEESAGIALVPRPDGLKPEALGIYRVAALLQAIKQYAGGDMTVWDASSALTGFSSSDFPKERALPTGCDFSLGASLSRWVDAAINIYFDDTDAPPDFSSILDNILGAMNGSYSGIDPSNAGQTSYTPNCTGGSAYGGNFTAFANSLNGTQTALIIFDDPCNQIVDLSGCSGILARGGSYVSSSTHTYKGDTWNNALWGFVVVNNGTFACLTPGDYEIMLTHELTHAYQMDHLNAGDFPNQNMNPSCCNAINSKDIECMDYTYDIAAPVQLTSFDVRLHQDRQVKLSWVTASEKSNDFFVVERSADGKHFEAVKSVSGNNSPSIHHYEWIDPLPFPGQNYYRLSQSDFDGRTNALGVRAIQMGANDGFVSVFPNPANESSMTVLLDLPNVFNGFMEITDMGGKILTTQPLTLESGRHRLEEQVGHLSPGVYWLRLREADNVRVLKFFKQ